MSRHRGYNPSHPWFDRMCALNTELGLQLLTHSILFCAHVIRMETAKPEDERVIDVANWLAWLEARRNWFRVEAKMAPDRITVQ